MRLIVLGDLHLTEFDDPQLVEARDFFFEEFFRQVAAHQADLVIAVGDTVTYGYISELTRQDELAAKAGLKMLRIPGNHDAYKVPKNELAPFFLGEHPRASQTDLFTTFDAGPVRFLLLDTTREIDTNWSGFVTDEQLAWLDEQIAAYNQSGPPFLVAMGHHPITGTTHLSELLWYNIFNSPAVQERFARLTRPPAFYVCGHNHSNSITGPDAQGWYYVQLGAPSLPLTTTEAICGLKRLILTAPTRLSGRPWIRPGRPRTKGLTNDRRKRCSGSLMTICWWCPASFNWLYCLGNLNQ